MEENPDHTKIQEEGIIENKNEQSLNPEDPLPNIEKGKIDNEETVS